MIRVLVTRSEPGASETAGRLAEMGYQPVVEPVFAIEPIEGIALPRFDALAFTSANGARAFASLSARRDVPVFCVGARTAEAAREAGFTDVRSADGDVSALASLIERALPPDMFLLHSGNEESRGDLAGQLKGRGISAGFVATFRAAAAKGPGSVLSVHLGGEPQFDVLLIHSPRAAAIISGFLNAKGIAHAPFDIVAISDAAASPLEHAARRIAVAAHPDEAHLLKALGTVSDLG